MNFRNVSALFGRWPHAHKKTLPPSADKRGDRLRWDPSEARGFSVGICLCRADMLVISLILLFAVQDSSAQNFYVEPALKSHVEYLCSPQLAGRRAGDEGEKRAAEYIWNQMSKAGLTMFNNEYGQDFSIDTGQGKIESRNIVGMVEGYDPALRNEYIVVGAHFDGIGTNTITINGKPHVQQYPGADDNASGAAMLIELAKLISDNRYAFARNVLFVGFGASECGTAGSWYFINRAFPDSVGIKAMINLDMLGRGSGRNTFRLFSTLPKESLAYLMNRTLEDPVVTPPAPFTGTVQTSDHLPFHQKNIPVFLFTTGMTSEYRTVNDIPQMLLYTNMERECNYIFHFLKNVAAERNHLTPREVKPPANVYLPADCDIRPQFFHNEEFQFLKLWVYKYLKYPQECVDQGIQGKVIVSFTVDQKGKVKDVRVERGVDELLDAEAVRVIAVSPDWSPGKIKGSPVAVRLTVPVEFRLAEKNTWGIKKGL